MGRGMEGVWRKWALGTASKKRDTEGLTMSLIRLCMKAGAADFPIFFVIALLFSPQLARRSTTQGFDGRGQSVHQCICLSLYFMITIILITMSFSKHSNFGFS
jgi:hypothetical protein